MLKTNLAGGNGGARALRRASRRPAARRSSASSAGSGADAIALVQSSSSAGAGPAGARAHDSRRRAPRRQQVQRSGDCRTAGRLARPGARGVPRAGRVRTRPSSRRTAACSSAEIRIEEADEIYELRAVLDEFVGRRLAQSASADAGARAFRPRRPDGARRRPRATSTPISRPTSRFTTGWSSSPATRSCSSCTGGSSTNCISSATRRWPRAACCPFRCASIARSSSASPPDEPAAAGRALYDHVMASRDADAPRRPSRRRRRGPVQPRGNPGESRLPRRQRPHLSFAGSGRSSSSASTAASPNTSTRRSAAAARRSSRRCARRARASPPIASSRRSPIRTTCRSSPARRPRCTASAATTSGIAMPAPK